MSFIGKGSFLLTKGLPLVEKGYPVVPIKHGTKFPKGLTNWQQTIATSEDIIKWSESDFRDGGVGILTGEIVAVDLDLWDENLAEKMKQWCLNHIGAAPIRFGNKPKCLLVYRSEEIFSKSTSEAFEDKQGNTNRIEILGKGQQFVAYAIHPITNQPYVWDGEDLLASSPDDLQIISPEQIESMFCYFSLLVDDDWIKVSSGSIGLSAIEDKNTTSRDFDDEWLPDGTINPRYIWSEQRVRDIEIALSLINPDEREIWIKVGMALKADFASKGYEMWDKWSRHSDKYEPLRIRKDWDNLRPRDIGMGSIFHMAQESLTEMVKQANKDGWQ